MSVIKTFDGIDIFTGRDEIDASIASLFRTAKQVSSLNVGGITTSQGTNTTSTNRCRTGFIPVAGPTMVKFDDEDYEMLLWLYTKGNANNGTYSPSGGYNDCGEAIVFAPTSDASKFLRVAFGRKDAATLTTDLTDPTSDWSKIIAGLSIYQFGDRSLSRFGFAADSKSTGDALCGLFTLSSSQVAPESIIINHGLNYETGAANDVESQARTGTLLPAKRRAFKMASNDYKFRILAYTQSPVNSTNFIEQVTNDWVPAGVVTYLDADKYPRIAFSFARVDDEAMDSTDIDAIASNFKVYSATDDTLSIQGIAADAATVGEAIQKSCGVYTNDDSVTRQSTTASVIAMYDALLAANGDYMSKTALTHGDVTLYEYTLTTGDYNTAGKRARDDVLAKPKLLICAGVHGYEATSVMSLYSFVKSLCDNDASLSQVKNGFELRIIPIVCPWGFDADKRLNENDVNINRNFDSSNWTLTPTGSDYSGAEPGDQDETQVIQGWLESNTDAAVFIDWHNSAYTNEISCLLGRTDEEWMAFKGEYLKSINAVIAYFENVRGIPDSNIFSYTAHSTATGTSTSYAYDKGIMGFTLETSWDIASAGRHSSFSIGVGSEVMGAILNRYAKS